MTTKLRYLIASARDHKTHYTKAREDTEANRNLDNELNTLSGSSQMLFALAKIGSYVLDNDNRLKWADELTGEAFDKLQRINTQGEADPLTVSRYKQMLEAEQKRNAELQAENVRLKDSATITTKNLTVNVTGPNNPYSAYTPPTIPISEAVTIADGIFERLWLQNKSVGALPRHWFEEEYRRIASNWYKK